MGVKAEYVFSADVAVISKGKEQQLDYDEYN